MKRTYIISAALCICTVAGAQSIIDDGLTWSTNDFTGSARTMGMGNAVTAVGGDVASMAVNPAGSAVAGYSQVEFTPGVSVSYSSSTGGKDSFQNTIGQNEAKFIFPSAGFTLSFNTGNNNGLTRFTFGFSANATNIYNYSSRGSGTNTKSSFAAYLADFASAEGYSPEELQKYNVDYCCATAYNAKIIERLSLLDYSYIGCTENINYDTGEIALGGEINQDNRRRVNGTKYDYVINFGFDISDIVYLGANLGITNLNYSMNDALSESECNNRSLFQTGFNDLSYSYNFRAVGTGVYGKFGVIVTPFNGLRIGAAIQTPTKLRISESSGHSMDYNYYQSGRTLPSYGSASSPSSNWDYYLVSPMRFNAGLAYTFGDVAMVSVDYELADYKMMRFRPYSYNDQNYFDGVNDEIQGIKGEYDNAVCASHLLRAGLEFKPISEFAVRAGYNLATGGRRNQDITQAVSVGCGYISSGSFYCDLAARLAFMPTRDLKVYDDYYVKDKMGKDVKISGPTLTTSSMMLNIIATFGWRF